jgi:two-component system sensor histidine kinase DesK
VEVAIYHIALEAVTNVIRRDDATFCHIHLTVEQRVMLEIQDDGRGLADDALIEDGMTAIRQRVAELGGKFQISNDAGTTVTVQLPVTL